MLDHRLVNSILYSGADGKENQSSRGTQGFREPTEVRRGNRSISEEMAGFPPTQVGSEVRDAYAFRRSGAGRCA